MARTNTIKAIRSTRANLNSQAGAANLLQGEPYLITDEDRLAVGLSSTTYQTLMKSGETITASQMPAHTGDVTSTAGTVALTLAGVNSNTGSFGSGTAIPTFTVNGKGLITAAGSVAPSAFTTSTAGVVPASGGGTTNFLRADGTWAAPAGGVSDGDKGDITVSSGAWTIDANAVTLAKIQTVSTTSILGRVSASTGNVESLTGSQATTLLDSFTSTTKGLAPASGGGTANFLRADGTWAAPTVSNVTDGNKGDITVSSGVWGITTNAVVLSDLAQVSSGTFLARATTGTGNVENLTGTQTTALLDLASTTAKGLAPVRDGTTINFLRGDGTYGYPTGSTDYLALGAGTLYPTGNPGTPTQGVRIYGMRRANRHMVGYIDTSGRTERLQPWLGSNNVIEYGVASTSSAVAYTMKNTPALTAVGTPAVAALATTNFLSMQRRITQTIATSGGMIEQYSPVTYCARTPGSSAGGFHISWRFGITALNTDGKLFCGISPSTGAFTNVEVTTLASVVGLGKVSSNTTSLVMVANGGSGTGQTIALPNTGSMTNIAGTFWQVEIYCKTGDTQFGYRVTRFSTTGVETNDEGVISGTAGAAGGIPADTTIFGTRLWGCSTSATTTTLNFSQMYVEVD